MNEEKVKDERKTKDEVFETLKKHLNVSFEVSLSLLEYFSNLLELVDSDESIDIFLDEEGVKENESVSD